MKKYYLIAIKNNNLNAMCNLGFYYYSTEKNCVLMKEYLLMAINTKAMRILSEYYQDIEKYNLTRKYLLMAIK
jgi:hypothetical protein